MVVFREIEYSTDSLREGADKQELEEVETRKFKFKV